mmetsp:Transcript_108500/g.187511  ORF Transcript_108500/g.187511 Transcript_108500/m.187511 type:complete len:111 (+) Transcript_108500:655-987(+)
MDVQKAMVKPQFGTCIAKQVHVGGLLNFDGSPRGPKKIIQGIRSQAKCHWVAVRCAMQACEKALMQRPVIGLLCVIEAVQTPKGVTPTSQDNTMQLDPAYPSFSGHPPSW